MAPQGALPIIPAVYAKIAGARTKKNGTAGAGLFTAVHGPGLAHAK